MQTNHFNTYSSATYSDDKRTLYLALDKHGLPRKVQTKPGARLGNLSKNTYALSMVVPQTRIDSVKTANNCEETNHQLRHHHAQHKCRPKKRKKKRKDEGDDFNQNKKKPNLGKKKCEEGEEKEECQKRLQMVRRKRKSRNGEEEVSGDNLEKNLLKKKRLNNKQKKLRQRTGSKNLINVDDGEKEMLSDLLLGLLNNSTNRHHFVLNENFVRPSDSEPVTVIETELTTTSSSSD